MTDERFAKAVSQGETLVCEVSNGPGKTGTVTGTAVYAGETGTRRQIASVRTDDGTLRDAGRWPSSAYMFTPVGHRIERAVKYQEAEATAEAIANLTPAPSAAEIADALADEVAEEQFGTGGWLSVIDTLAKRRPDVGNVARVTAQREARTKREVEAQEYAERRARERDEQLDKMTAVAVHEDASIDEIRAIRARVLVAIRTKADGTALTVATRRHGNLPELNTGEHDIAELHGMAIPLPNGRHMIPERHVRVRWQESPDESDVSGVFNTARGRTLDRARAGERNLRILRKLRKAEAARERLEATLGEAEAIPAGAIEIKAARDESPQGYGTRWYACPNGRVARTIRNYDWPTSISASQGNVSENVVAAGLGIRRDTVPKA